jgi:hypothetical protein
MENFNLPLMSDNVSRDDINAVVDFLQQDPIPRLTNGPKVKEFESRWSEWVGMEYSVMVNSGTAANELTITLYSIPTHSDQLLSNSLTLGPLVSLGIGSCCKKSTTALISSLETLSLIKGKLKFSINLLIFFVLI